MNEIVKVPMMSEEVEIKCPKCGSSNVLLIILTNGCYDFLECHKCGYKNKSI